MKAPMLAAALALAVPAETPVEQAERLAAEAVRLSAEKPAEALTTARRALGLTVEFDPVAFVKAGRKGEVVEDEFLAAREDYRHHRSKLYAAMGEALARNGSTAAARHHFGRAVLLNPKAADARLRLGRILTQAGRGREALFVLLGGGPALAAEPLDAASQAADRVGLPSLQAALDRVRLLSAEERLRPEIRDGPVRLPERARLSTGEPARVDTAGPTLVYVADAACRSCSGDLLDLRELVRPPMLLWLMAAEPEQDAGLRSVVASYRYRWPYLGSAGRAQALDWPSPAVVAIGRGGFLTAIVRPPFATSLPPVLQTLQRRDVSETVPRPAWNRLAPDWSPPPGPPGLLPNGLAPGEDEPAPEPFARAVSAFDAGRAAEALRIFEELAAAGDGWLLGPEARFDRALCLGALGRSEEARRLLLRIGDSRFQDAVDRALEASGRRSR